MEEVYEEKEIIEEDNNIEKLNEDSITIIKKKGFWSGVKSIWKNTIFSDWIKDYREEKKFKSEIRRQAKREALVELKGHMIEKYKKDELDKMMGVKKENGFMSKIGKELESMGEKAGKNLSGMNSGFGNTQNSGMNISEMLGVKKQQPQQPVYRQPVYRKKKKTKHRRQPQPRQPQLRQPQAQTYKQKEESYEDKIKRMMS